MSKKCHAKFIRGGVCIEKEGFGCLEKLQDGRFNQASPKPLECLCLFVGGLTKLVSRLSGANGPGSRTWPR